MLFASRAQQVFIAWQVFDGIVVIVSFSLDIAFRFVSYLSVL